MSNTSAYVAKSFIWGTFSKVIDAIVKFISIPLLLNFFGKEDFGLITLAISVNAYLQLLNMGINTGSIKFFSEWIGAKKFDLLDKVARTSITFYGIIGIVNALILLLIVAFGMDIFSLTDAQKQVMQTLFLILAFLAIINWSSSVFNQLITANENIAYVQKINILRSCLGLIVILATIYLKLSLTFYFVLFSVANSFMVIPFYFEAKKNGLIQNFIPAFDWANFSIVFKYSLAILAMGIFQVTASRMRPVILSIFSKDGVGILTDYRIMETITLFIISIGGMLTSIFLPKTSKLLLENNRERIEYFAYKGTLYTSIICVILCFPFILVSKEILFVYVGSSYVHLSNWLILWIVTILFYLHNSPVASLVLAVGKTKMLVYSSAVACIVSLVINALLTKPLDSGAAVLGYSVYIAIQMLFYYFYFNNKVLGLNSWMVFKSFIVPTMLGFFVFIIVFMLNIDLVKSIGGTGIKLWVLAQGFLKGLIWLVIYGLALFAFKIIDMKDLLEKFTLAKGKP